VAVPWQQPAAKQLKRPTPTAAATGMAKLSPVFTRTPSQALAISTPAYPPTKPKTIVLPFSSQTRPVSKPGKSPRAKGSFAPIIAPQNAPRRMAVRSRRDKPIAEADPRPSQIAVKTDASMIKG